MVTHLHVGLKVEDYARWKAGYDASIEQRKASGEISYKVYRSVDEPNTITVLSVQESAEKVRAFMASPNLQAQMKASGITQMGEQFILEETDSGTH